jgi:hypothetical protein
MATGLHIIKSQISSTKFQINLKFQYSMSKTLLSFASQPFTSPGQRANMPVGLTTTGAGVWDFEFDSLGFI